MLDIEQYKDTVYFVLNKYHLDPEEFEDVAWIGLWEACKSWNPEKAEHRTPQTWCIRGILFKIFYEYKKWKKFHFGNEGDHDAPGLYSFQTLKKETISPDNFTDGFLTRTASTEVLDNVEYEELIQEFRKTLKGKEKDIFDKRLEGYTMVEIGSMLGVSKQYVSDCFKNVKKKAVEFFDLGEEYENRRSPRMK